MLLERKAELEVIKTIVENNSGEILIICYDDKFMVLLKQKTQKTSKDFIKNEIVIVDELISWELLCFACQKSMTIFSMLLQNPSMFV